MSPVLANQIAPAARQTWHLVVCCANSTSASTWDLPEMLAVILSVDTWYMNYAVVVSTTCPQFCIVIAMALANRQDELPLTSIGLCDIRLIIATGGHSGLPGRQDPANCILA
jgi:hypothetical protein